MAEVVEQNAHMQVGGHAANWTIYDDAHWQATYGPHSGRGEHDSVDDARAAAKEWLNTFHHSYTSESLNF